MRLGVETVRAIRDKRLDVRLVFTFVREFPVLLEPLHECAKTGWGFAPDNHPLSLRRAVKRIDPFALIWVGGAPAKALIDATASVSHRVLLNACATEASNFEYGFPATDAQAASLGKTPQSAVCDLYSLLANAHVDPNFVSAVNGGSSRHLWWLHTIGPTHASEFGERFRRAFPGDILFVSGCEAAPSGAFTAMSAWDRQPMKPGIAWVDESKWLPAVAAAAEAAHFAAMARDVFWQAMAGGLALTTAPGVELPKAPLAESIQQIDDEAEVLQRWDSYAAEPIAVRRAADAVRRQFWEERRLAAQINEAFLQRVFDW